MSEYYTWTKGDPRGQAMLDAINNHEALPIVGHNAATGQPAPDKQKTTAWANELTEFVGDIEGFPRVPSEVLDRIGIDEAQRSAMLDAYEPNIVEDSTLERIVIEMEL